MTRAAAKTKSKARKPRKSPPNKRKASRAKAKQPAQILDFPGALARRAEGDQAQEIAVPSLLGVTDQLQRAMDRCSARPLPRKETLEAHFDTALDQFTAVWSAEIGGLLRRLGAQAAVLGDRMALPRENVSFETLAHETAHLLQVVDGLGQAPSGKARREDEAEQRATDPGSVGEALPDNVVALRDASLDSVDIADPGTVEFRTAQNEAEAAGSDDAPVAQDAKVPETQPDTETTDQPAATAQSQETDAPPDGDAAPQIDSQLPELPQEAKEAQAALEASIAALTAAATPEAYMSAFKAAPPSLKADKSRTLEADLAAVTNQESDAHVAAQPEFSAELKGDANAPPSPAPVTAPAVTEPRLEDTAPGPIPDPEIEPTQDLGRYDANDDIGIWAPPGADRVEAAQVADSISEVSTTDPTLQKSPGPPPKVQLVEAADPKRVNDAVDKANSEVAAKQDEAAAAVINGKGPEQVQMREVTETTKVEMEPGKTQLAQAEPVEGAQEFLEKDLDSETRGLFDAHHHSAMEASLNDTEAQMGAMVQERDARRVAEDTKAREDLAEAEGAANEEQRKQVGDAREDIQHQRQSTLDQQAQATQKMRDDADKEGKTARQKIDDRVTADEARVEAEYKTAEAKAEAEVQKAEKDAEAEKKQAEKDAANRSWWERAIDWVAEQLSKLGKLIGKIFELARKAVGTILDGVKKLAHTIIDAAAAAVKVAIEAYASVLKVLVTHVIGAVFPELAEALNKGIDAAVERAKAAVDKVAKGLKAAVSFIVDTYKAALNAIISFVEGALNTVLAVAAAALKGDWAEVARLVLEPILKMLGIDKEVFYQFVGKTIDALGKIIDEPLAFLSNLFGAVVGGFQLFGKNILDHLIKGMIGWLTGALGSTLTIPKKWDLMGVLDLARQILGLTLDMVRRIAVRILGEAAVEKIEFFLGYATELITKGWGALFEQIMGDLKGLFSSVAGEITAFIVEKVVKAGIVWVASLINPAGALAKLVLMIWDLIMWLKDNLMRFVDVITTVVNGMIDIANGKLEPASKAIEKTLSNLLAPAIDLLARLLGLGNVAGRVKKIIENVRKKIEDAIVKLIKRVMAKFTGKGKGKSDRKDDDKGKPGAVMKPKKFAGAGETHTLFLKKSGKGVKPMMRSVETEVATWLNGLKQEKNVRPYVERLNKDKPKAQVDDATAETLTTVGSLIPTALTEVGQLDQQGDEAQTEMDKGSSSVGKEVAEVETEAKQTVTALEAILKALGAAEGENILDQFKDDLQALDPKFGPTVQTDTFKALSKNPKLLASIQNLKTWDQLKATILANPTIWPKDWARPLHAGGVLRNMDSFMIAFLAQAKELMEDTSAYNGKTYDQLFAEDEDGSAFMQYYFLKQLADTAIETDLVGRMLTKGTANFGNWCKTTLDTPLRAALRARSMKSGDKSHPDTEFKDAVAGSPFKKDGFFAAGTYKTARYRYYKEQDDNGNGVGVPESKEIYFVDFLATNKTGRQQANITHMANRVRAADKAKHEWIPSSLSIKAMEATIKRTRSGAHDFGEYAEGYADLLHFQHAVRTETSYIVFSPAWITATNKLTQMVPYLSREHVEWAKDNPGVAPDDDKWLELYPNEKYRSPVRVFQGHAGGIEFATSAAEGEKDPEKRILKGEPKYERSQRASPAWHGNKSSNDGVFGLALTLFKDGVTDDKIKTFGRETIAYFDLTVLTERSEADPLREKSPGKIFDLYNFTTGGKNTADFDRLLSNLISQSKLSRSQLSMDMSQVIGPL